ncbi:MAG: HIT family protein [Promethearchaeota archaeon]
MKDIDCIFCKITEKKIPSNIIFENDLVLAFLDISPISTGHMIVIPKNHYSTLEDIPNHELAEVYNVVKRVSINLHQKLQIDGYNVLQNNFKAAGQVVNHFHVHIIPRSFNDRKFSIKIPRTQAKQEELNEVSAILKF